MGPVMPPSKKPESSGISVSSGLSQCYRGSGFSKALQEDDDLDFSLPDIRLEEGAMEDEELTNLNWLHESKNLLKSFGDSVLRSVSPVQDLDDDTPPSPAHSDMPYDARQNPNCKPPYSFSCLIFMAIEDSPTKRLPVKDIYNWILEHFPYFANAPTGWKNSVRHNLSLNKCFKKVDKERSQSIGKGSLWCIDPEYRQNLIQALKKTPYHPHSNVFNTPPASPQAYQSTSGPPLWPGSTFFKRNGALLQDPDIDAASAMMLLNTPPEIQAGFPPGVIQNGTRVLSRGLFPGVRPLPITPIGMTAAVRNGLTSCRMRTESEPSCGSPVVSGDPKEDHNYSSAKSSNARSTSPASDSVSSSSADDHYEFATKGSQEGSEGSEGSFQSHESHSETEEDDRKRSPKEAKDALGDSGYASQHKKRQHLAKARKVPSDTLPLKKRRTEKPPESDDEEMKEAAGSLLHLAGIRSCLNNITNRTAKGQKEQKETTKN
ncbi:forkhead box protein N3 isoform X4 [Orcinus orca]|uniref:Forkhead box protein N3 n=3 Tax=Odontoceti TaxID=9722 RepID=A0A2U4A226_TURTR|nr:forkhead box protein N3 isoform X4 [Tursiops truncatus]XP_028352100.1 forkhead box protein N3 isoform X6 [Physeter catodon]XP_030739481.1 forkhead box protein N3 isoform X1 [Globicephala melas]XP_030739482.1 forkhead box protein N3 isoform X1 [Globicephala melas]XP_033274353.1 forkhead box protein N3 isoform X4 [Orcinus orca]XP_033706639.1 forkhead box protein N3 isoform X4 [Tursiops truncatus]XP_049561595.1 forkhead box protein N3 isoform X4 [Orcinus orca]XP_059860054.1 forkhead box prot|eukprot:XP_028352100.1 forkhead box protein N3 isoform X6 [Physeter catodon]